MGGGDTIFALASGAVKAGVSVFRVSGPAAGSVIQALTGRDHPKPRFAALRKFVDSHGAPIDEGLVLWFPGPASFTGEDVAELHTHGSPAVIEALSAACLAAGARMAGPGEFTRRAFENGRMDLTEAEGLADLIDAQTEGQRRQALRQMQGGLKDIYESWREGLIDALAAIEGEIDFPDEQDVPDALSHAAYVPISKVRDSMRAALSEFSRGETLRQGVQLAIIGPPNAGKSTLLNRLARREAAIVSEEAGTTRDIIEVNLDLGGIPVTLADTAGLRETDSRVEAEGVRRALSRSANADLRIGMVDISDDAGRDDVVDRLEAGDILLLNKTDAHPSAQHPPAKDIGIFAISAQSGEGFDLFLNHLQSLVSAQFGLSEAAGLTRARHRDCVYRAAEALERAAVNLSAAPELSGDDVRLALHAIKELAGEADIEAVLGAIFSRFCIGK